MSSEKVCHEGIVDHLEKDKVFVRIITYSACDSCRSKSMCSVMEMKEKLIEARTRPGQQLSPGEQVRLEMKRSMGNKAVVLGYLVPFILLIASLLFFSRLTGEGVAGLLALLFVAGYYVLLHTFKSRLSNVFYFEIYRNNEVPSGQPDKQ